MGKHNFYAVANGRVRGVFNNWDECKAQVDGFAGGKFKGFATMPEAQEFLRNNLITTPKDIPAGSDRPDRDQFSPNEEQRPRNLKRKSDESAPTGYAERDGAFYYTGAAPAQRQHGPIPQVRPTQQIFHNTPFRGSGGMVHQPAEVKYNPGKGIVQFSGLIDFSGPNKRQRNEGQEPISEENNLGNMEVRERGQSGSNQRREPPEENIAGYAEVRDQNVRQSNQRAGVSSMGSRKIIEVYTDGSCFQNGRRGAKAGIGVFWGPADPRNLKEPLPGKDQTNNRAELWAAIRAIQMAPQEPDVDLTIHSDSQYLRDGVSKWIKSWKKGGKWETAEGNPVKNRDLWEQLDSYNSGRWKGRITWNYVPGHSGIPGNEAADFLADEGARMPSAR
ncbi:ribonuclease H-like domain-containing protein [Cladochytrium replicatum]|nr:ribonuclease H-like domain-containing protein [Cladochytrium replicatum]